MKRIIVYFALSSLMALSTYAASPPQNATITVNATNGGVFTFTLVRSGTGSVVPTGGRLLGPADEGSDAGSAGGGFSVGVVKWRGRTEAAAR